MRTDKIISIYQLDGEQRELAEKFNLSEKTIREIIAEYIKEQRDEGQLKLF